MAQALGRSDDEARWTESADKIQRLILGKLYVAEDGAFYDLDAQNHFVRVRSILLSTLCSEHVVDQQVFDRMWKKQLGNPDAFWVPFPLPSIALDDPSFVGNVPANSWGGPSQALTALRAGRWFDFYRRSAEFSLLMDRWCEAIQRDMTFRQQMDPQTGLFAKGDRPGYSPVALVLYDFTWRLAGVREVGETLRWCVRPDHPAAKSAHFRMWTQANRCAEMKYSGLAADLLLEGKQVGRVTGGSVCLITDPAGTPKALLGIADQTQHVILTLPGRPAQRFSVMPNQELQIR